MEELLDRKKADLLTSEEVIEVEEIGELDRIFTHINAMLVAQWMLKYRIKLNAFIKSLVRNLYSK